MADPAYVLITAAYNEEQLIAHTIESVVAQTVLPKQWVIVSDASTDRTDEIVERYSAQYSFIRLIRVTEEHARNFAAQVNAIQLGATALQHTEYEYIGNLDADVTFAPSYFAELLGRLERNTKVGLAGGVIQERDGTISLAPPGEALRSVPHAIQLFRRACFESVGGYPALRYGGPDTYAEVVARMKGWEVEGYPDLVVQHHRYTGSASGLIRGRFRQGCMDFSLGYDPVFQILKCARRWREKPAILGALVRLAGFCWSGVMTGDRVVSEEFIRFLRAEQQRRVRAFFASARRT